MLLFRISSFLHLYASVIFVLYHFLFAVDKAIDLNNRWHCNRCFYLPPRSLIYILTFFKWSVKQSVFLFIIQSLANTTVFFSVNVFLFFVLCKISLLPFCLLWSCKFHTVRLFTELQLLTFGQKYQEKCCLFTGVDGPNQF